MQPLNKFEVEEFNADVYRKAFRIHENFMREARRNGVIIWCEGTNAVYWLCVDTRPDKRYPTLPAFEPSIMFATRMGARAFCNRFGLEIYHDQGNLELSLYWLGRLIDGDPVAHRNWTNPSGRTDWINHHGDWQKFL